MFIFIIGLILSLIGMFGAKNSEGLYKFRSLLIIAGLLISLTGLFTKGVVIINPGEVGIKILFGKVDQFTITEGMNFVNPFADVERFTIQTQNFTMSSANEQKDGTDNAIRVLSDDGLEVLIDVTVLYRVDVSKAGEIWQKIGPDYEAKVIQPITRTRIRENAVNYEAVALFSNRREEFQQRINSTIKKDLQERGFILEQLLIRNISLPQSVKESIERKITAIQESQRMQYVLDKGRQEAELKRVEAQGVADAQRILSEALTPKVLQYETIKMQKELANSSNSKIIILGDSKNTPFFLSDK